MNKVAVLSGDGIGPEVMAEALKVLDVIAKNIIIHLNLKKDMLEA